MEGYRGSNFQSDCLFRWIVIWLQSWKNRACSWQKVILADFWQNLKCNNFEPYEEWSWNFQDSILFMKASYGLSFNNIWGVSHGHFRNSWWFDMEWPTINNPMWLFVAKPLLNAKNVINGHSLYVIYDILCPCNQCFWLKVPFITFMWLLGTKSHIAPKEIRWPICFTKTNPFSPNQLTTLGFYKQIPILMIIVYVIGKRGLWIWSWLATNIHKETLT